MQFNTLNLIQIDIIFIYVKYNVHKLILIYTIFIYVQFTALLNKCLLFVSLLMYIIIFTIYAYTFTIQPFVAAKRNKTIITDCS